MNASSILLVEDDVNDVFFFGRALKKAGVTIPLQVARDGREAMAYLSGTGEFADREKYPLPCLIVLDLNMPGKNGFEVLGCLRQTPSLNTLPVVILTSSQAEKDIERARELGARDYYVKPNEPGRLFDLVKLMMTQCSRKERNP
jgi:CheY-like chemotaxis protein